MNYCYLVSWNVNELRIKENWNYSNKSEKWFHRGRLRRDSARSRKKKKKRGRTTLVSDKRRATNLRAAPFRLLLPLVSSISLPTSRGLLIRRNRQTSSRADVTADGNWNLINAPARRLISRRTCATVSVNLSATQTIGRHCRWRDRTPTPIREMQERQSRTRWRTIQVYTVSYKLVWSDYILRSWYSTYLGYWYQHGSYLRYVFTMLCTMNLFTWLWQLSYDKAVCIFSLW